MTEPWPTLTEFLDAGGGLVVVLSNGDDLNMLLELLADFPLWPESELTDRAECYRDVSRETLEERDGDRTPARHFAMCRLFAWESDLLSDPALAGRVLALLTPEQRAKVAEMCDLRKRPHPLSVDRVQTKAGFWNCDSCGAPFAPDVEAIFVGSRPGWSEPPSWYPIHYCRGFIATALDAYDAGSLTAR
jgi:hypothetical protein